MSTVERVSLDAAGAAAAAQAVAWLCEDQVDLTAPGSLERAAAAGRGLPGPVREALRAFAEGRSGAALVLSGYAVACGPTPLDWRGDRPETRAADAWLLLVMAQLGDPVSWRSLQEGRLITDIMPIRGHADAQTGHSSSVLLDLHVEDAFSDLRCDHLGLLCLRNEDEVATTVVALDDLDLRDPVYDPLFEPRYVIRPDTEHLANLVLAGCSVEALEPPRVAALSGDRARPEVRLDPPYMESVAGDREAQEALGRLVAGLGERVEEVALDPGDVLVVDNRRALHGRRPFTPRYDGTDRWLRRLTTVRDLARRPPGLRDRVVDPMTHYQRTSSSDASADDGNETR